MTLGHSTGSSEKDGHQSTLLPHTTFKRCCSVSHTRHTANAPFCEAVQVICTFYFIQLSVKFSTRIARHPKAIETNELSSVLFRNIFALFAVRLANFNEKNYTNCRYLSLGTSEMKYEHWLAWSRCALCGAFVFCVRLPMSSRYGRRVNFWSNA